MCVLCCGCVVLFCILERRNFGILDVLEEGFCVWLYWGYVGVWNVVLGMWDCDFLQVLARFWFGLCKCVLYMYGYML